LEERSLLAQGKLYAWRLSISTARNILGGAFDKLAFTEEGAGPNGETGQIKAKPDIFGDPVVARKDFGTSYHLASVYDDADAGVTHVIRGQDLFHAAHLHVLIYALLDFPSPVYRCHKLILGENGRRLAKRDKSVKLKILRENGMTQQNIRSKFGFSGA
jgi:glutamyl-Q tRNA(Asp) synthetase